MAPKIKSSVITAVFLRKGGEGIFTKVLNEDNLDNYNSTLKYLNAYEKGLIVYYLDNLNWTLLTDERLIITVNGLDKSILYSCLNEVTPALLIEFKERVTNKHNFTRLVIKDNKNNEYVIKLEMGKPYEGIYQALHYIANSNQ